MSKGVRAVKDIPKRKMVLPDRKLLGAMTIIRDYNETERGCTRMCKKAHKHVKKKIKKKMPISNNESRGKVIPSKR